MLLTILLWTLLVLAIYAIGAVICYILLGYSKYEMEREPKMRRFITKIWPAVIVCYVAVNLYTFYITYIEDN